MNTLTAARLVSTAIVLIGCVACQSTTELHRGRTALLSGMPDAAVPHFKQAAAIDENLSYSLLHEGVWTYLGRSYYDAKNYGEARKSLERAVAINNYDGLGSLYLGLALARQGNHDGGRAQIVRGLGTLYERLDYIVHNTASGFYWDTTGHVRADLQAARREVTNGQPTLDKLFGRLENLGNAVEREIDLAAKDETITLNRRFGDS